MMNERETDVLLRELFKRNAPYVNESIVRDRIEARLPRRRRRSSTRKTRAMALAFASLVLVGGVAFGVFKAVTYMQGQPALLITDSTAPTGDTGPSEGGAAVTSVVAGLVPVSGTATLGQVKTEGTASPADDIKYVAKVSGQVLVYSLDMSQSGISGTLEITSDLDLRADGSADIWGSWILTNEQGTWECPHWNGLLTAEGLEQFGFGRAVGYGAYRGLTLYLQWHSAREPGSTESVAGRSAISGWIVSAD